MRIEDSFTIAAPVEQVWAAITDPEVVAPCIPGCEGVEVVGPTAYKAAIKVQVGPIKARFKVDVEVTEEVAPERILSVTRGEEGGRASNIRADNRLELEAVGPNETVVRYASEVAVTGRLAKFGLGIMKKKAKALGDDFAQAFRARVEQSEAA
jgi:carbon monoxide dehydrogenase subunit G